MRNLKYWILILLILLPIAPAYGTTLSQTSTDNEWAINSSTRIRHGLRYDAFPAQTITSIDFKLSKTGLPTGLMYVRVRDLSGNILGTLGSKEVSTLTGTLTFYTFNTTPVSITTSQDIRIMAEYEGGDASNTVVMSNYAAASVYSYTSLSQYVGGDYYDYSAYECTWQNLTYLNISTPTTVDVTNPSWTTVRLNGSITANPSTQYAFVWGITSQLPSAGTAPASAGYDNNYISSVGSYSGAEYLDIALLHPTVIYFRFACLNDTTWNYGGEIVLEFGIYNPGDSSLGHDIIYDGTNIYYSWTHAETPYASYVKKMNQETMEVISSWTAPANYAAQGLTQYGSYIYVSLWSPSLIAKVVKVDKSNMTTTATYTAASGDYQGYFIDTDGTYIYQAIVVGDSPPTYGKVKKIQISDMTEVASYTHNLAKGIICTLVLGDYVYVGTFNASSLPRVVKLNKSDLTYVSSWDATSADTIYILRIVTDGTYIYAAAGGGAGNSDVFKINPTDMTLLNHWTSEGTSIPDGSGAWGLVFQKGYIYIAHCSAPSRVTQINPFTMTTVGVWTGLTGQDCGDCLATDGTYFYVGLDDNPAILFRMNPMYYRQPYSGFINFQNPGIN